ncbi:MAG: TIM barrel protein [Planctomycetota bacterium]|nr:TIM barrel protein [Planctomycetota bacterium]
MTLLDIPDYANRHLKLRGVNVPASMLSGWSLEDLDQLRDRADKATCPCLVLVEDTGLKLGAPEPLASEAATRVRRLATAANRLGCNAISLCFDAPNTDEAFDNVSTQLKALMPSLERLELNVLIAPYKGLTTSPDRLTDLIKRVGGFRIGSMPNFGHAAESGNTVETLRKLAPYAGAIHATVLGFTKKGQHKGFDLSECVKAIRSVGFLNTLAIDFIGEGDPVENIEMARVQLEAALEEEN